MLYFDVTVAPFYNVDDTGQKIAASLYNHSLKMNNGRQRGVMTGKILPDSLKKALTWDVERGAPNELVPLPWQTCTCIGGWHYDHDIYENNWYKSAAQVAPRISSTSFCSSLKHSIREPHAVKYVSGTAAISLHESFVSASKT